MTWIAGLATAVSGVFNFINYKQQLEAAQTAAEYELLLQQQKQQQMKIAAITIIGILMIIVLGWVVTAKIKAKNAK